MTDISVDPDQVIRVMPETLANKIAAGEVVQRPASAAKELIENALDAGASAITVILKAAGSELIQVVDDGCGMGQEDALLCVRRHATSKIRSVEDLERIQTLGFRGEALASIAAVAQVELRTRRLQDAVGTLIRIHGGALETPEPCATPPGTSVAVRNLFFNVPARRNFLKTPATEFKHLVETFQFLSLANPSVGFTLMHEDNEVYRLSPARTEHPGDALRHRIGELLGKEHAEHLIPVDEATSYLSVSGFIAEPAFHRRSRGEQFLFVNGRYVNNRSLDHAIQSTYEDLMPEGAYPFYAVFLDLDPRHVDVNVHPTKAEIKFDDERGVYGFLKAVIRKTLGSAGLTPMMDEGPAERSVWNRSAPPSLEMPAPGLRPLAIPPSSAPGAAPAGSSVPDSRPTPWLPAGELTERLYAPPAGEQADRVLASGSMEDDEKPARDDAEPLLWQLHHRYVLTQIRSGLMILDQHAAHERILYERALQSLESGFGLSQQLLFPHTLDFDPADFELLRELLPDLRSLGFDIEVFSGRSVVVRGVPADIRPGDERAILDEILQQYKSYRTDLQIKGRDNLAKSIAHRSSIPSGKKLSVKEMRTLVDQLFLCEMPYASPHGRPTIIKISIEELDKRFGRGGGSGTGQSG